MEIRQHLEKNLKRLKMPGLVYNLELRLQEARDNQLGYPQVSFYVHSG